jgi:hypothetical protein
VNIFFSVELEIMCSSSGKVQEYVQVHHTASLGKKYSIQRGHISEVLQLEQELEPGPESASVQEPELGPSQERGLVLKTARVLMQVQEPAQGQALERVLVQVRTGTGAGTGTGTGTGIWYDRLE